VSTGEPRESTPLLGLLGEIQVHQQGHEILIRGARLRSLLAVLLVDVNRPVPAEQVIDRVWGEGRTPERSANALQTQITLLRRVLTPVDGLTITWQSGGYRLAVDEDAIDLHRFRALVAKARLAGEDDQAATLLDEALRLWRGEPCAGLDGAWFTSVRAVLGRELYTARSEFVDIELRRGHHRAVLAAVSDWAHEQPLDEGLAGQLMVALYRCGRQAEALEHYHEMRRRLSAELGTDPGPRLSELHHQLLTNDPVLAPPATAQRDAPTRAADLPVPSAAATVLRTMIADTPTFTGREDEIAQLVGTALDDGDPAGEVHVLDGMPGVGKTTLAVHVAHRLADRFPDGQLFLNLHGHTPDQRPVVPADALLALLVSDGVDTRQIPATVDERAALWRARMADRRMLLLFDNADNSEQVKPLLPSSSTCIVLVTSRNKLIGLDDSHPLPIHVLPPEQAAMLLRRRSRRYDSNAADVAELAELCGYLPLAITLTAAQVRAHPTWTMRHLVGILNAEHDQLGTLRVEGRTLAAVFQMSYDNLNEDQRRLFRLISLHPGTEIDVYAAAALLDSDLTLARRLLDDLYLVNLLAEPAPGRYRQHDLLRAYARALARQHDDSHQRTAAQNRLLDYYLRAVATADVLTPGHHRPPAPDIDATAATIPAITTSTAALDWLNTERANLTACAEFALANGNATVGGRLAASMDAYLRQQGYWAQAAELHAATATVADDQSTRAIALTNLARVQQLQGEIGSATDTVGQALALCRAANDHWGEATALIILGKARLAAGDTNGAIAAVGPAQAIWHQIGDRWGEANALTLLGRARFAAGDFDVAWTGLSEVLELRRDAGDLWGEVTILTDLGQLRFGLDQYPAAATFLARVAAACQAIGERCGVVNALSVLALVRETIEDYVAAAAALEEMVSLCRDLGEQRVEAYGLTKLGGVRVKLGQHCAAINCYQRALTLYQRIGASSQERRVAMKLKEAQEASIAAELTTSRPD
jgi:DNA-binding SARP family transcriptional activator/tetratricopeptide (TPR) repeat protein